MNHLTRKILLQSLIFCLALSANNNVSARILEFPVRFVILSNRKAVKQVATEQKMRNEVRLMNQFFVSEKRKKIVRFKFHSFHPYESIKDSPCKVVKQANQKIETIKFIFKIVECVDTRVFFPGALNIYIIDTYTPGKGYREEDSYGGGSGNRRMVALDYQRLGHIFAAEEHELGHLFSLGHVCHPGANKKTNTNIMTQRNACPNKIGHEGNRSIGFNEKQVAQISGKAKKIYKYIKSYKNTSGLQNGGFENLENYVWNIRGYTSNHRSGKYALWVGEKKTIYQKVFIKDPGQYQIRFYYNAHGKYTRANVKINDRIVAAASLPANGGYNKPFREHKLQFLVNKPSILEVGFYGGNLKLWVDDVSLFKVKVSNPDTTTILPAKKKQPGSANGKYSILQKKIYCAKDKDKYGTFKDDGFWKTNQYCGYNGLPSGYWVYEYPHWYIWQNSRDN